MNAVSPEEAAAAELRWALERKVGAGTGMRLLAALDVLVAALRDARRERDELDRYGRITTEDEYFAALRKAERERDQARDALAALVWSLDGVWAICDGRPPDGTHPFHTAMAQAQKVLVALGGAA